MTKLVRHRNAITFVTTETPVASQRRSSRLKGTISLTLGARHSLSSSSPFSLVQLSGQRRNFVRPVGTRRPTVLEVTDVGPRSVWRGRVFRANKGTTPSLDESRRPWRSKGPEFSRALVGDPVTVW